MSDPSPDTIEVSVDGIHLLMKFLERFLDEEVVARELARAITVEAERPDPAPPAAAPSATDPAPPRGSAT